jgi:nucleoid DNA-binding protein
VLIPALTEQGFTVREASSVIDVIFESVKDALLRHEHVELPIGMFEVMTNAKRRIWRFGKVIIRSKYRVVLLPDAELQLAAAASPGSPHRPERPKRKKKVIKSELDICVELIVDFVRRYIADRQMFFDELCDSPCLPGLFQRAKPEPADIRPLDEAEEVIAELHRV